MDSLQSSNADLVMAIDALTRATIANAPSTPTWTAWTPTVTAASGTFTTASATGRFSRHGYTVTFSANLTITTVGTGSGGVVFTLPAAAASTTGNLGSGREDAVSGKMLQVKLNASTGSGICFNYDNTSPIAAGSILRISGQYEAA